MKVQPDTRERATFWLSIVNRCLHSINKVGRFFFFFFFFFHFPFKRDLWDIKTSLRLFFPLKSLQLYIHALYINR